MADTYLWRVIQQWMDGQIVRVNQSQLADAVGVNRQSLTQWKQGQARPSPANLRSLRRVTRLDWTLLTDALLRDMGYVEEAEDDGTATVRAGGSPAVITGVGGVGSQAEYDVAARTTGRRTKGQMARERQDRDAGQ